MQKNNAPIEGMPLGHNIRNCPLKVLKGWGYELWIVNFHKYCAKILHFNTEKRCSYHYHMNKEGTWYIQSGEFVVSTGDRQGKVTTQTLKKGDVLHIPPGVPHRIICKEEGDIFETSTKHEEEDSYRIEKGD